MSVRIALATAASVIALLVVSHAQTTAPASTSDAAVAALVSELRAARSDLAQASERSLRFQLLLARLQLQEQRIANLDRQRADIAKAVMDATTMSTMFTAQFAQFARSCEQAAADDQKECEAQLETMKSTATSHQTREQQLRAQEGELLQAIAAEQGRWSDFSARLDDLERALARPR
jgi:hypothetical protein